MKNIILKSSIYRKYDYLFHFAKVLGITEARLSHIINGRTTPNQEMKRKISELLGVPENELFPEVTK
jgi:transcriptional regulator with XRE-family HTH domain